MYTISIINITWHNHSLIYHFQMTFQFTVSLPPQSKHKCLFREKPNLKLQETILPESHLIYFLFYCRKSN